MCGSLRPPSLCIWRVGVRRVRRLYGRTLLMCGTIRWLKTSFDLVGKWFYFWREKGNSEPFYPEIMETQAARFANRKGFSCLGESYSYNCQFGAVDEQDLRHIRESPTRHVGLIVITLNITSQGFRCYHILSRMTLTSPGVKLFWGVMASAWCTAIHLSSSLVRKRTRISIRLAFRRFVSILKSW